MRLIWTSLLFCAALVAAPADLIVTAGKVLTMDAQRRVIDNGAVAVLKGRIVAVGTRAEIDREYKASKRIERPESILIPGLINGHTHAAMSLLRGLADDVPLDTWLTRYIFPAEAANVDEAFVRAGTRLAMLEMMLGGITTYADMYYFEDAVADETVKAGMRGVLGETIIGFPAPDHKTPEAALEATAKFIAKYKGSPLVTPAVAPHAIYTNSRETLVAARELANKHGVPMLIHVSETQKENVESGEKYRITPTGYLEAIGALKGRTVFAHGVWMTSPDRMVARRNEVGLVHCPSSNSKLGSGIAPITEFLRFGINVGLGTDGPAGSNNDFDIFREMDVASKVQKATLLGPTVLPAKTMLEMATIMGAKALGLDKEIGSIEQGKRADLVTVATSEPHAWPAYEPYAMLVYSMKASDVEDVVIEGRITVLKKKPLTLNPVTIRREAASYRAKVDASLTKK